MNDEKIHIAGMSIGGGKKENFFFSLLEYFPDQDRWFLSKFHQLRDENVTDSNEAITNWIKDYNLKQFVIDFPLSRPACPNCTLECPGIESCHDESVTTIRSKMGELLAEDKKLQDKDPKQYERDRIKQEEIHFKKDEFQAESDEHLLSKSFKRRLKKGYLPYWNRPVDFWIWTRYYNQLLNLFKVSFDSFGDVSMMLLARYNYIQRHIPSDLEMFQSDVRIALLEMYRAKVVTKKNLIDLNDFSVAATTRLMIIESIEKKLNVFIYKNDLDLIVQNPKAFDSFILSIVGKQFIQKKCWDIPDWATANANFIAARF
jgi:hypothetical protein